MFDVDHFKTVNDKHGHLTGDYVLREMCRRILPKIRAEQQLARCGGEEFAVLLPESDLGEARTCSEEIRRAVCDTPFEYEGDAFGVTISLGLASIQGEDVEGAVLVKRANENLFRAKREGRNRAVDQYSSPRWIQDVAFRSQLRPKCAIIAASLSGRSVALAREGGAAVIDDVEGLLFVHLRELSRHALCFGRVDRDKEMLISLSCANAAKELEKLIQSVQVRLTLDRLARAVSEAPPVFGQVIEVELDREAAISAAVRSLVTRLADAESRDAHPTPIAVAARHARAQSEPLSHAMSLVRLHETLLRWFVTCVLAGAFASSEGRVSKALLDLRAKAQKPISTGVWMSTLRDALREVDERYAFASSWRQMFAKGEVVLSTLDEFVADRNELAHRGGSSDERMARKMVERWEPRFEQVLAKRFNAPIPLEIADVNFGDTDEVFDYTVKRWTGDASTIETSKLLSSHRMRRGCVYLAASHWDRVIPLGPFAVCDVCPSCGSRELFMLDKLSRDGTQSTYVNPATGHSIETPDQTVHRPLFERLVAITPERP
jgi:diguanylate cyclase (GGDEF)-like protein